MRLRFTRALLLALFVSARVAAQTVWTVTAINGIQAAINAASPGDVLVLGSGGGFPDYHPFTLNKGLTIRGNGARVGYVPGAAQSWIEVNIPPGQVAHIERLDTTNYTFFPSTTGCELLVNGGSVRFEQCTLRAQIALSIANAKVVVTGGTVTGASISTTAPAIQANGSHLTLRDCTVTGPNSTCGFPFCPGAYPARPAVAASGSVLHAERVQLTGGSQGTSLVGGRQRGGAHRVHGVAGRLLVDRR